MKNIRILTITALLAFVLGAVAPVLAQGGNFVVVNTSFAHIRSGPSFYTTSLGTVPGGTELDVTGRNAGATWWRVESPHGVGWVSGEIADFRGSISAVPVVSEPVGTLETSTVIADRAAVNVYQTPTTKSFILGVIPTSGVLVVTGITLDGDWFQVETTIGTGYVSVAEVAFRGDLDAVPGVAAPGPSFNGPTVRLDAGASVMTEPGGSESIGTLDPGTTLPTGGRTADNSWWYVASSLGLGWIPVSNVSLAGSSDNILITSDARTPGPGYSGAAFAKAVIAVERKIAYNLPGFDNSPMWDTFLGTSLSVTARSLDGAWLEVTSAEGYTGWIHFSGITLVGDMAGIPVLDTSPVIVNRLIVNTSYLNVRSGPGVEYTSIYVATGGDVLEVDGKHPTYSWIRVIGDFGTGWVQSDYIVFRGNWLAVPWVKEPEGEPELPIAIVETPHNVYAEPDWNMQAGVIPSGMYTIIGWTTGWTWAEIETPLGVVWLNTNEFTMRGIANNVPIVQ